ncbi:MAG: TIGR02206 family membrane protein [Gemmatimonadetes bacterium]|nr:TIGR02206 family membrane protein [Gemmatimonadota bacterium]MCY3676340.1 TIGR02206 family membrane protein [Gemmatimonadota bacterium]MYA44570.1 TIGR02206 family membrane protein [Gemmatimonadota bacterium]MYE95167.1 TIGR02206 family membrane protein [Gemmatimonadota bacterium]MYJ10042.1 TIGR02206 family membrane protein [Gemmatimonadota bacterium]
MSATSFQFFGPAHIAAMVLMVAVAAAMTVVARRSDSPRVIRGLCIGLAAVLLVNQSVGWVYRYATEGGEVFVREHLPLHVCGMTILLSAAMLLFRRRWTFEIVYFWGLAGATNAMVTPELSDGFPHYLFFQYFISHGAIVVAALFATFGLGMRPTFRSLLRAFVALNVMAVAVTPVNLLVDGNYMYLRAIPDTASPFIFLPWPWYLLKLEVLAAVFFGLLYLPVYLEKRWRRRLKPALGAEPIAGSANTKQ